MPDKIVELETLRDALTDELTKVKSELYIRKKARHPRTTQNRLILEEGEFFWAIGYRNHVYHNGEWSIHFTNDEKRAIRMAHIEKCRDEAHGQVRVWKLLFAEVSEDVK